MHDLQLIVGDWTVDSDSNTISRNGTARHLQPLTTSILVYLASHADRVVTTEELITEFWPRRVVGDDAVHRRIADLRKNLGDDARHPAYIRTVSKRGYQLVAKVQRGPRTAPVQREAWFSRPVVLVALAVVVLAIVVSVVLREKHDRDLLAAAMGNAESLIAKDRYQEAYLGLEPFLEERSSDLRNLLEKLLVPVSIETDPTGIAVEYRIAHAGADWVSMGATPISDYQLPRGHYKLRLAGSVFMDATNPGVTLNSAGQARRVITLPSDRAPDGMSFIPAGKYRLGAWGFVDEFDLGGFYMDRYEISNRDFQAFVDAGGYQEPAFWQGLIDSSDDRLTWETIRSDFVDLTGRPGPAFWELGSYPPGEGAMPVVGVSWYEANAYLAFAGKTLPGAHHWLRAALGPMEWKYPFAAQLVPSSNVGSTGLLPVDRQSLAEVNGIYDLIGNAAEWTGLDSQGSKAVIGAGFRDPPWTYNFPQPRDPMQRLDDTGFRGMLAIEDSAGRQLPDYPLFNDFTGSIKRVSDEEFAGMKHSFEYKAGTLGADDVTLIDEVEFDQWTRRKILISTGRPDDPLPVFLYIPRRFDPPYQAVIYLPPADSWSPGFRSENIMIENYQIDFVPRSGRVLIWPVYSGSQERYGDFHADSGPERATLALERNRRVRDEVGRVIDYLEGNNEFDGSRVALMALSYGATLAPFILATEARIKAAVIYSSGIAPPIPIFANPQNDPNVFWARVRLPILLANGRYDPVRPYQFVLAPLFDLIATPTDAKKFTLYDSGHWPLPRRQMMGDSLEWLERYLGKVPEPSKRQ